MILVSFPQTGDPNDFSPNRKIFKLISDPRFKYYELIPPFLVQKIDDHVLKDEKSSKNELLSYFLERLCKYKINKVHFCM